MAPFFQETIEEWLTVIGLSQYYSNFRKMHIVSGRQLEILKTMSQADIKKELGILKLGQFIYHYSKNVKNDFRTRAFDSSGRIKLEQCHF